ncbi:MAG TPA: UDP-N-acetylmuramoyl-tripeptide--D-alanyl-D-alanine ligase [Dehalococcoidia bacterium]|nr:UDP-N-acetylmuramoyl-tripeptide--D-alanyl-D-alanine ligase [Dehalococcoidia bacterium]
MNGWLALALGVLVAAPWGWWAWRRLRRAVQILQLEEYENGRTLRWAARSWWREYAPGSLAVATLMLAAFAVALAANAVGGAVVLAVLAGASGPIAPLIATEPPAKKPLAFTMRVRRLFGAAGVAALLLAALAMLLGWALGVPGRMALLIVPVLVWLCVAAGPLVAVSANLLAWPVEAANRRRYREEARARLRAVNPRIVAITGSYGKTTTKELVATVLESRYRVLKTPRSFNTPLGITRTINDDLRDDHEVFVVEMGAYEPGNIRDLCRFVGPPEVSAITGINEQHLERMGSIENTIKTKYEIVEETRPGGTAVFNIDNAYCAALANKTVHVTVVRAGAETHQPPSDLRVSNVALTPKLMRFDVTDGEQSVTVRTRLLGRHLIPNLLIALAIGRAFGVELKSAAARLATAQPVEHRLVVKESDGLTVIDDAYSANVNGAHAALELLAELPAERRFLVTPGIVELGPVEAERNREFGAHAAKVCDVILVVGQAPGRWVREGALTTGMAAACAIACAHLGEAQGWLRGHARPGDAVLFENDLPDQYQ